MKVFFSPRQLDHRPQQYMRWGKIGTPVEIPERLETMAQALVERGLTRVEPTDFGTEPLLRVHDAHYVETMPGLYERWTQMEGAGPEVLPNVHPWRGAGPDYVRHDRCRNTGPVGQAGFYIGDMSCAMGEGSWRAAYASAQTALSAAQDVLDGAPFSLALCRPPGHHCYPSRANGFCFLNNAAIAAMHLRQKVSRVAILDFDTHHGDGTQAVFYNRPDVLVASCHTDPTDYYPFFAGFADERGAGAGEGYNLNIPLAPGSGDETFIEACQRLAAEALSMDAEIVILSAGWDAHRDDPLSKLNVTTDAYRHAGEIFGRLGKPTVIVQEGGYSLTAIAQAAPGFLEAFAAAHPGRVG